MIRHITGDLPPGEQVQLMEWLSQSAENQQFYKEVVEAWQYAGTLSQASSGEMQPAFQKLRRRIEAAEPQGASPRKRSYRAFGISVLKYAAVLVPTFLLGGAAAILHFKGVSAESFHPSQYLVVTPNGTRSEITLADGTRVWLNAGSSLSYTENYNIKKRQVQLSGEAYFTVAKDKTRPFVVRSGGMEIQALGTAFNVKAYPSDNLLTATLVEGSIRVDGRSRTGKFTYTLEPNQNITLRTSGQVVTDPGNGHRTVPGANPEPQAIRRIEKVELENDVNTLLYTSWKDRRWVIEQQSFVNFAEMLERRYNVKITYDANEMKDISFSGTIENETLEQVIRILQLSAPLQYKFGKGEVEISLDRSQVSRFRKLME